MKKKKRTSLEKRLRAYSAAAAGTLLLAPSAADAVIQYSGLQNLPVNSGTSQSIDLNNDGNNDFNFAYWNITFYPFPDFIAISNATSGIGHIDAPFTTPYFTYWVPARLPSSYNIRNTLLNYIWDTSYVGTLNGEFFSGTYMVADFNNQTGYIGVSFETNCGTAYGWIQYQGNTVFQNVNGTIIDWAYEDDCGVSIRAGETQTIAAPTLNQWGIIILIALLAGAGTLMLKKKEETS